MIIPSKGDIIAAETEAMVNTVNCDGFMGKGLALQFKRAFPDNYAAYRQACDNGELRPGRMLIYETGGHQPKYIINFPTKDKWRLPSKMEYIESGLEALIPEIRRRGIKSVAIPPLGAGLGRLDWRDVRPLIEKACALIPEVEVRLFEPTAPNEMTTGRAMLITLLYYYIALSWHANLLGMQKLAYFLQNAGQPLRLHYVRHQYGPYAEDLNKVMEAMEGRYTRGYTGSRRPDAGIDLMPRSYGEARLFLGEDQGAHAILGKVQALIAGYESSYGLELLSTVHWLAEREGAKDGDEAVIGVWGWSERKRKIFKEAHIRQAWADLEAGGWIKAAQKTA